MAPTKTKHVTVSMNPEDVVLIDKLTKSLKAKHGALTVTALFRLALRNMVELPK